MYTNKLPSVTAVEDSYIASPVAIWNWQQKTWKQCSVQTLVLHMPHYSCVCPTVWMKERLVF